MVNALNFNKRIEDILLTTDNTFEDFKKVFYELPSDQRHDFLKDISFRIQEDGWEKFIRNRCEIYEGSQPNWDYRYGREDIEHCFGTFGKLLNKYNEHQIEAIGYHKWLIRKEVELNEVSEFIDSFNRTFSKKKVVPSRKLSDGFIPKIDLAKKEGFLNQLYFLLLDGGNDKGDFIITKKTTKESFIEFFTMSKIESFQGQLFFNIKPLELSFFFDEILCWIFDCPSVSKMAESGKVYCSGGKVLAENDLSSAKESYYKRLKKSSNSKSSEKYTLFISDLKEKVKNLDKSLRK